MAQLMHLATCSEPSGLLYGGAGRANGGSLGGAVRSYATRVCRFGNAMIRAAMGIASETE